MIRSIAAVLSLSLIMLLACVASEQRVDTPPPPVRVDTTATETGDPNESVQPDIVPLTPEEVRNMKLTNIQIANADTNWELRPITATDTAQPLRKAPSHTVHFDAPALPTPILDERVRPCIGYPLTAGFSKVRYNLLLQPNLYDVTIKLWSDPKWRETFRVDGGTFPVSLWRIRGGVPTFWKQVRVQAGPGLPTGTPQTTLSASFFRGGDDLCVESPRSCPALFIAYDQQTGQVVQPQLSQIQNSSNDSTPIPGAWSTVGGVRP